jgi:hypothetical protein
LTNERESIIFDKSEKKDRELIYSDWDGRPAVSVSPAEACPSYRDKLFKFRLANQHPSVETIGRQLVEHHKLYVPSKFRSVSL